MKFKFNVGQKVRILDGSNISDYECSWNPRMSASIGRIVTITEQLVDRSKPAYRVAETGWSYDERGLMALSEKDNIKKIIFSDPATIVLWTDGSKTVVKAHNEPFDPEKGVAMCFMKKACDNKGSFNNVFKKWIPDDMKTSHRIEHDWKTYDSPSASGWYIAITSSGLETDLHYSEKYETWNAFDDQSQERVDECSIKVIAWRHMNHDEL